MSTAERIELASRLPDVARWVEVRDLLVHDDGALLRFESDGSRDGYEDGYGVDDEPSFTLRDGSSMFVIGIPPRDVVAPVTASPEVDEVVATMPARAVLDELLRDWSYDVIIVHELCDETRLVRPPHPSATGGVRFLDPSSIAALAIDDELRGELEVGARHSPIAASFVGSEPVAFCYAGATTETLWDVSIDTLPDHRRQGHAARCAAFMIQHMRGLGKEPVWQSAQENPASWKLAAKLGFVAVDHLALWTRPQRG